MFCGESRRSRQKLLIRALRFYEAMRGHLEAIALLQR